MSVYHLCYCLQPLLLLLRKNYFFSSPKTSQQSVRKPYRPLLLFNSPWIKPGCDGLRIEYIKLGWDIWTERIDKTRLGGMESI